MIGAVVMAATAVAALGHATDVLSGELADLVMSFIPGVFRGMVLGVGLFGAATRPTDAYGTSLGLPCLLLPLTFLFNLGTAIAGFDPPTDGLGVVRVLALSMLAIGSHLRTGGRLPRPRAERRRTAWARYTVSSSAAAPACGSPGSSWPSRWRRARSSRA